MRKLLSMVSKRAAKEFPELAPFLVNNSQSHDNPSKCHKTVYQTIAVRFRRCSGDAAERFEGALIVLARAVNGPQDGAITLNEETRIHYGNEVKRVARIVAGAFGEQAPFFLESAPELSVRQRRQKPDHRERDRAFADKVDLTFEDVFRIMIKADNETCHHFHSVALNLLHRIEQVAAVL